MPKRQQRQSAATCVNLDSRNLSRLRNFAQQSAQYHRLVSMIKVEKVRALEAEQDQKLQNTLVKIFCQR